jgi:hypothetical protein
LIKNYKIGLIIENNKFYVNVKLKSEPFSFIELSVLVPDKYVTFKFADFPDINNKKISNMIKLEYDKYFVTEIENSVFDFTVTNRIKKKVLLVCIETKHLLYEINKFKQNYNLIPEKIVLKEPVIINYLLSNYTFNNYIVVFEDNIYTSLIFVRNRNILFFRHFNNREHNFKNEIDFTINYVRQKNKSFVPEKVFTTYDNDSNKINIFKNKYNNIEQIKIDKIDVITKGLTEKNNRYKNIINIEMVYRFIINQELQ